MAKVTAKEVLSSHGGWIIKKVMQGRGGKVRIDAQRRYHKADQSDFFSEWVSLSYANRIRREEGLSNLKIDY